MIYLFIWVVGTLFSFGLYSSTLVSKDIYHTDILLSYCALALFWPHYLGYYIGCSQHDQ